MVIGEVGGTSGSLVCFSTCILILSLKAPLAAPSSILLVPHPIQMNEPIQSVKEEHC